mmetsp:Transcript_115875/g.327901  ORF Transcript_115875/g.327901 Transcript_115875/m.327901 type:complete len:204 (+) Transcript_115875:1061-1672(+)
MPWHHFEEPHGLEPLPTFATSADGHVKADHVGAHSESRQIAQERERLGPLHSLSADADYRVEAGDVRRHAMQRHLAQQPKSGVPLLALFARGDGRFETKRIGHHIAPGGHLAQQVECLLPFALPGASGQPIRVDLEGSSFVSGAFGATIDDHGTSARLVVDLGGDLPPRDLHNGQRGGPLGCLVGSVAPAPQLLQRVRPMMPL